MTRAAEHDVQAAVLPAAGGATLAVTKRPPNSSASMISLAPRSTSAGSAFQWARTRIACRAAAVTAAASSPFPQTSPMDTPQPPGVGYTS